VHDQVAYDHDAKENEDPFHGLLLGGEDGCSKHSAELAFDGELFLFPERGIGYFGIA
jgi:hypothetical protein